MLPTFAVAVDHVCSPLFLPLELFQIIGKGVGTIQTNSNIQFIVILLVLILLLPLLILLLLILLLPLLILRCTLLLILLLNLMIILRLLAITPTDPLDLQNPRHVHHGLTLGDPFSIVLQQRCLYANSIVAALDWRWVVAAIRWLL